LKNDIKRIEGHWQVLKVNDPHPLFNKKAAGKYFYLNSIVLAGVVTIEYS